MAGTKRESKSGRRIRIGQNEIIIKLDGEDTGGRFSLSEYTMQTTAASPPLHFHEQTYEAFFLLDGVLECTVGGKQFRVEAGDTLSVPPSVVHSYTAVGSEPAKFLLLIMPAGFERYFIELGEFIESQPKGPVDMRRIRERATELCNVYDQTVVGSQ